MGLSRKSKTIVLIEIIGSVYYLINGGLSPASITGIYDLQIGLIFLIALAMTTISLSFKVYLSGALDMDLESIEDKVDDELKEDTMALDSLEEVIEQTTDNLADPEKDMGEIFEGIAEEIEEDLVACPECSKSFSSEEMLENHVSSEHEEEE